MSLGLKGSQKEEHKSPIFPGQTGVKWLFWAQPYRLGGHPGVLRSPPRPRGAPKRWPRRSLGRRGSRRPSTRPDLWVGLAPFFNFSSCWRGWTPKRQSRKQRVPNLLFFWTSAGCLGVAAPAKNRRAHQKEVKKGFVFFDLVGLQTCFYNKIPTRLVWLELGLSRKFKRKWYIPRGVVEEVQS